MKKGKYHNLINVRSLIYILCNSLAVCVGIVIICIGGTIAVAVGTGIMAT